MGRLFYDENENTVVKLRSQIDSVGVPGRLRASAKVCVVLLDDLMERGEEVVVGGLVMMMVDGWMDGCWLDVERQRLGGAIFKYVVALLIPKAFVFWGEGRRTLNATKCHQSIKGTYQRYLYIMKSHNAYLDDQMSIVVVVIVVGRIRKKDAE